MTQLFDRFGGSFDKRFTGAYATFSGVNMGGIMDRYLKSILVFKLTLIIIKDDKKLDRNTTHLQSQSI